MLRSMISGISGLKSMQGKMDVVGNNIANVSTTAFKSSRVTFRDVFSQTINEASAATPLSGGRNPNQIGTGATIDSIAVNFLQGGMQRTDNPLDFFIQGDGFFVLSDAADGSGIPSYSRAGNFNLNSQNQLVNSTGKFVLDVNGQSITYPDNLDNIIVGIDGQISGMDATGTRVAIATIALATFPNPVGLMNVGGNCFGETTNSGTPNDDPLTNFQGKIINGVLEMSNVDLATEFTEMITAQRGFQANSRVITTSDSMLEELVNLKR